MGQPGLKIILMVVTESNVADVSYIVETIMKEAVCHIEKYHSVMTDQITVIKKGRLFPEEQQQKEHYIRQSDVPFFS